MINGQGPFRFIVDTGASRSTVTPELVQKLGLHASADTVRLNGITGTAQVPAVKILSLQAGDLRIENIDVPVVWAPLMAGADGFLGAAGLTAERLLVDFAHNRVVISSASRRGSLADFMRIHGTRVEGGLITVAAVVAGVRVRAVIDTGSERSLGNLVLQSALSQRHHPGAVSHTTNVYGATTDVVPGDAQTAPTIAIADLRIADVTLVYGDFNIFKVWNMEHEPALIIGMDVLGTVERMAIDFQHADLFLGGSRIGGVTGSLRSSELQSISPGMQGR
jgi:predicted aspartyl protease